MFFFIRNNSIKCIFSMCLFKTKCYIIFNICAVCHAFPLILKLSEQFMIYVPHFIGLGFLKTIPFSCEKIHMNLMDAGEIKPKINCFHLQIKQSTYQSPRVGGVYKINTTFLYLNSIYPR